MTVRTLSNVFDDLNAALRGETVSIADLLTHFQGRGLGFIVLIFAVPMALPLPVPPGINILLASPLILLTAQQALGRKTIWLPNTIKKKTLKASTLQNIIISAIPWLKKLEILLRPRLSILTSAPFTNIIGMLGLIMALTVCIPLPLTNTIPSFGIALMAIGVIMCDGLAVIAGALIGTVWVFILAYALIFIGTDGIDILKETLTSWL